jgi:hypothetical protein
MSQRMSPSHMHEHQCDIAMTMILRYSPLIYQQEGGAMQTHTMQNHMPTIHTTTLSDCKSFVVLIF